ncbi:hypothetical protein BgiBS90_019938, partial [Biomphalaria glabrata]
LVKAPYVLHLVEPGQGTLCAPPCGAWSRHLMCSTLWRAGQGTLCAPPCGGLVRASYVLPLSWKFYFE